MRGSEVRTGAMSTETMPNERLIARWIEPSPYLPGVDEARIRETGVPVWALIGYLPAVGDDPARVAHDYELPVEAVQAALAYYRKHRPAIDARLAQNAGTV
jgi:uncharacterized protein (DUF433 family)